MKQLLFLFLLILSFDINAQAVSNLCNGETKTLTATNPSGSTGTFTYLWTFPNNSTATTQSITTTTNGTYSVVITCSNGCSASFTHVVNIEPEPTVVINANDICQGTSQTISATGVPAGYTYDWNFGVDASPATSTSSSTSVTYSSTGTKTITLVITKTQTGVSGGCGSTCTFTFTKNITVSTLTGGSTTCN